MPSRDQPEPRDQETVPPWLWWSTVSLLILVLVVGFGFAGALALGWRSPTPRRAPDWKDVDLLWTAHGDALLTTSGVTNSLRLLQPEHSGWAVADAWVSDFEIEFDAYPSTAKQNADFGLLFRYRDPENHYQFAIGNDGYYSINIVRDGITTPFHPWQQWPHVRRGDQKNRLRVRCSGPTCRFFINGEFTAETTDDAFLEGKIGVWAESHSDWPVEVTWREFKMWVDD